MLKSHTLLPHTRSAGTILALALLAAALTGCGAAPQTPGGSAPSAAVPGASTSYPAPAAAATAYPAPLGGAPAASAVPGPTQPSVGATAAPTTGVPAALPSLPAGMSFGAVPTELATVAVADLMQRASVAVNAITVVNAEAVEWPDGAIGCPKPDTMYPQVITPGFKLVLAVNGQQYNYHASERGAFFLCEK